MGKSAHVDAAVRLATERLAAKPSKPARGESQAQESDKGWSSAGWTGWADNAGWNDTGSDAASGWNGTGWGEGWNSNSAWGEDSRAKGDDAAKAEEASAASAAEPLKAGKASAVVDNYNEELVQ